MSNSNLRQSSGYKFISVLIKSNIISIFPFFNALCPSKLLFRGCILCLQMLSQLIGGKMVPNSYKTIIKLFLFDTTSYFWFHKCTFLYVSFMLLSWYFKESCYWNCCPGFSNKLVSQIKPNPNSFQYPLMNYLVLDLHIYKTHINKKGQNFCT